MQIYGSKFWISITLEFQDFLDMSKILKNWHLKPHETANQWHIQKSKAGYVDYPRLHLWTDSWSNQSMPSTLLAFTNVSKNGTFIFNAPLDPLNCVAPSPQNGTTI